MTGPSRAGRSAARYFVPAVAWTVLLVVATSLPGATIPATGSRGLDKVAHFGLYLVLAVVWRRAVRRSRSPGPGAGTRGAAAGLGWLLVPGLAIFAGLDELHQAWIPGRTPSVADWGADLAGIAAGVWLEARRSRRKRTENPDRRSRDGG